MSRRLFGFVMAGMLVATGACGDDDPPPPANNLPQAPQLLPNAQTGVIAFGLTVDGESDLVDVVFVNGGKDDLVVTNVAITGRDATAFNDDSVTPSNMTVPSREALAIRVSFTPPGRGVYIADLTIDSNAANLPSITVELVGPGAGAVIGNEADIFVVEDTVAIGDQAGISVPTAIVRFFNLGGAGPTAATATLSVDSYVLGDASNFAFLRGTALPGIACDLAGVCVPEGSETQGCCGTLSCSDTLCVGGADDGNSCIAPCAGGTCEGSCGPVRAVSGDFVVFGVRLADGASAADTTVTLNSNDPDQAAIVVNIDGTP